MVSRDRQKATAVYDAFMADPTLHLRADLGPRYREGMLGIKEPSRRHVVHHAAWRAGRDAAKAEGLQSPEGVAVAEFKAKFGDTVENGWASSDNPFRTGIFVRSFKRTGRLNPGLTWEITDGNGKFWEFNPKDIGDRLTVTPAANLLEAQARRIEELTRALRIARSYMAEEADCRDVFPLGLAEDAVRDVRAIDALLSTPGAS